MGHIAKNCPARREEYKKRNNKRRHAHAVEDDDPITRIVIMIMHLSSKGLDKEDLERLLQLHLHTVSIFLMFSLIYAWPISFYFVYLYICLYIVYESV